MGEEIVNAKKENLVLGRLWAGHVYGTNVGRVFVKFDGEGRTQMRKLVSASDLTQSANSQQAEQKAEARHG